ncbi:hypothetical protein C8J57DRAFT_1503004 [Mycena rebaudengoi]|nr:hypothetical protein C8J57DRAFT_1503004 [Mycena rebaudengoi]
MPMDAWDGNTDVQSAQDFLHTFHWDTLATTSNADKAKAFKNYLVSGSEVDVWYQLLSMAVRNDMDQLDAEIEAQYAAQVTVQPSKAEYGVMLVKEKLKMEELGTKVKIADRDVWAHHAWASKVLCYATSVGVEKTMMYIEQVCLELPCPIRTKVGKVFANWAAFVKEVREIDTVELEVEMKEWCEEEEKRRRVMQLLEGQVVLQASPTAGIRTQLTRTTISTPAPTPPRWPAPAAGGNMFRSNAGGQGNLFAAPHHQQYQQTQQQGPTERQQLLVGAQKTLLLAGIARIPQHPPTDAGQRDHGAQQQAWYAAHGNIPITINTPYPLRPGNTPANSGKCFQCGMMGHTNIWRGCQAPVEQCLSPREQTWRRIAWQALREPAIVVQAVGYSSWEVDD